MLVNKIDSFLINHQESIRVKRKIKRYIGNEDRRINRLKNALSQYFSRIKINILL